MIPDAKTELTVIVLTYNRCRETLHTLDILSKASLPNSTIMVVDNASSDGTRQAVREQFPEVSVISLPINVGISGWDYGVLNTESEYVLLLDDDCAPDADAVPRVLAHFREDPNLGVLPLNIYGGAFSTEDWASVEPAQLVGFINCAVGLRRSAMIEAGLNDPDFFLYANEWDLTIRILAKGYGIAFDPQIRANHRAPKQFRSARRVRTLSTRNETWMVLKYFPPAVWPRLIARVFLWNAFGSARFEPGATLQGLAAALVRLRRAYSRRQAVPQALLRRYEDHFWSFRPFLPRAWHATKKRLFPAPA